jgi:hypothetical protein
MAGDVVVSHPAGRVEGARLGSLEGWRLAGNDAVDSKQGSWTLSTHQEILPGVQTSVYDNGVVAAIAEAGAQAKIPVETKQGNFSFSAAEQRWGVRKSYLNGRAIVERVPDSFRISESEEDQDYPAMTQTGDNVWRIFYSWRRQVSATC